MARRKGKPTISLAKRALAATTAEVSGTETDALGQAVATLPGVGGGRASRLAKLGIRTVGDLLWHGPRRYEDRNQPHEAGALGKGDTGTVAGTIVASGVKRMRRGKSLFEFILDDGTARLHCRWWNMPYMERYYKTGDFVHVHGRLTSEKPRTMNHPEAEVVEDGEEFIHLKRIVPVYRLTDGVKQRWLRAVLWRAVDQFAKLVSDTNTGLLAGDDSHWLPLPEAFQSVHFPDDLERTEMARERLALEEFIRFQRQIRERRTTFQAKAKALPCGGDDRLVQPFLDALGFVFTGAQQRAWDEIGADMAGPHPMRRLLQGDVGCGKTAVAACAALRAIESGFSVVVLAPTEILAEQHYRVFGKWLEPLGIPVHLHTGAKKTMGDSSQAELEMGNSKLPPLVIGTHALVEDTFALENIGLAIIDEQHKFGVEQRKKLVRKGRYPHVLVMTATPIPRTLGLTVYGDLDCSVIDEMPPGRGRVRTHVRTPESLPKVWGFIREQLTVGRQAYIVYPRVDDEGGGSLKAVNQQFDTVREQLEPHAVGLLHGRLKPAEKEEAVAGFLAGKIKALLATSVIEVGVDIPNATILLVENADRFGLAQLHQLRGRIGRGAHESHCILVVGNATDDGRRRLEVMEKGSDGFELAEEDLRQRGPGELLGQAQSGLPDFKFGNLIDDWRLIQKARDLVAREPVD
ncbi:MAG: ATP-dependent DNA helicase RecG [Verrucomicrobiota bacterium]|nr:ATP-dependent DNA helicase RecG [Verrucomicrobiota bacterium]